MLRNLRGHCCFYVYTLTDPRDDSVFYVGKGQRNRMHKHTQEVRENRPGCNPSKIARIREILEDGLEPVAVKVAEFWDEMAAFSHERDLIAAMPGLTNIAPGGGPILSEEARKNRERRLRGFRYWKNMTYLSRWLKVVETWPGVTFPYLEDGDRKAEELVAYARQRVAEWERLKERLRATIPVSV